MGSGFMRRATFGAAVLVATLAAGIAPAADAAASRTFVASSGTDANPCSLALPCRSFAAALTQTSAGGEIVVLDSAGYGTVVIDKAVTITAPDGVHAGITVPTGSVGILVSASATDDVLLRGLSLNAQGAYLGVLIWSARTVTVDRCAIRGFGAATFNAPGAKPPPPAVAAVQLSGVGNLHIRDSVFTRNFNALFAGYSGHPHSITIERSTFADSSTAINAYDDVDLTVVDSVLTGTGTGSGVGLYADSSTLGSRYHLTRTTIRNFQWGVFAIGPSASTHVIVADSDVSHNAAGIYTAPGGNVWLTGTRITHNTTGVVAAASPVHTSGTNYFADNGTDGDPLLAPSGLK